MRRAPNHGLQRAAIGGLLIVIAGVATGCTTHTAPPAKTPTVAAVDRPGTTYFAPAQRRHVPLLSGSTLNGTALSVDSLLEGHLVVINVWAAWCTECRAESTALAALSRQLAGRGVTFVGIDEQDNPGTARAFVASVGSPYPSIVDPDGRLLASLVLLPNTGIPSTLVVNRHALMAGRIIGAASQASLGALVEQIAAGD